MYKIIKDGTTIGLTEFLTYIKQHDNGCFVLCPEPRLRALPLTERFITCWGERLWKGYPHYVGGS